MISAVVGSFAGPQGGVGVSACRIDSSVATICAIGHSRTSQRMSTTHKRPGGRRKARDSTCYFEFLPDDLVLAILGPLTQEVVAMAEARWKS